MISIFVDFFSLSQSEMFKYISEANEKYYISATSFGKFSIKIIFQMILMLFHHHVQTAL